MDILRWVILQLWWYAFRFGYKDIKIKIGFTNYGILIDSQSGPLYTTIANSLMLSLSDGSKVSNIPVKRCQEDVCLNSLTGD